MALSESLQESLRALWELAFDLSGRSIRVRDEDRLPSKNFEVNLFVKKQAFFRRLAESRIDPVSQRELRDRYARAELAGENFVMDDGNPAPRLPMLKELIFQSALELINRPEPLPSRPTAEFSSDFVDIEIALGALIAGRQASKFDRPPNIKARVLREAGVAAFDIGPDRSSVLRSSWKGVVARELRYIVSLYFLPVTTLLHAIAGSWITARRV
jgi:hypothetical protein